MDRTSAIILGLVFGGLFLALFGFLGLTYAALERGPGAGRFAGGDAIGVLEIEEEIRDARDALEALRDYEDDKRIKAVLVRIDSPGGAVAASQEIYSELLKVSDSKPVVCSLGDVAASGGYYIAAGCDQIIANPGTLTGSIGVIAQLPFLGDIADSLKFKLVTLKSGLMKDVGNPFRPMTDEERKFFQTMLDSIHEQFIAAVAEGRNLTVEEIRPIADGRVLTGEQALSVGLVDQLGNFNDAITLAAELGGIKGTPTLRYPPGRRGFSLEAILSNGGKSFARGVRDELVAPAASGGAPAPMVK